MNVDKRSVHTDALETLGNIISPKEKRDAIHIAVEPVQAGHKLRPGQDVGLNKNNGLAHVHARPHLGIVDPFLKRDVEAGEWFWLLVYPRQIKSLRHVWSHPAFKDEIKDDGQNFSEDEIKTSTEWLKNFCEHTDCPGFDALLSAVRGEDQLREDEDGEYYGITIDSDYFHVNGSDAHGAIPAEFWFHMQVVTGMDIPEDKRPQHFSCSC